MAHDAEPAADGALRFTDRTVAAIGSDLGYSSESAFSNAFKRVLGQSPSRYRSAPGRNSKVSDLRDDYSLGSGGINKWMGAC
jgi:AraC-like DNA-binding protein